MKKTITTLCLALAILCLFLLAGCSNADDLSGTMMEANYTLTIGNRTSGYSDFADAWKDANKNTTEDVIITCDKDIAAKNGKFGEYGELTVAERTGTLTLDLNGHTIDRGLSSADDSGAVFAFFNKTGTIIIKNGTITGGNKTQHGGGIYVDSDNLDLTLENITITGNTAGINGGGMYINGCTASVTLNNVTVTGNNAGYGGGIHWDAWTYEEESKMANLQLCGKVVIKENSVTGDADYSNLVINPFPSGSSNLSLSGMSEESEIHLALETDIGMPFTAGLYTDAEKYQKCFVSERNGLIVAVNSNSALWLKIDEENNTRIAAGVYRDDWGYWEYFESAASAWTETDSHKTSVTMKLYMDWTANENGNLGEGNGFHDGAILAYTRDDEDEITLDLNGHTINRGLTKETAKKNGCIFYLDDDYSPHITVKNGTLTGGANTEHGGAIDNRADHGVFWLDNVIIQGNYSEKEGGGIYFVSDENYLCLKDVTITMNTSGSGGSFYIKMNEPLFREITRLCLYGKIKVKDNYGGNMVTDAQTKCPIYTEFSDDIEEDSIFINHEDDTFPPYFCEVGGDETATLKAFHYSSELQVITAVNTKYITVK